MEDFCLFSDFSIKRKRYFLFIVLDGHNGAQAA